MREVKVWRPRLRHRWTWIWAAMVAVSTVLQTLGINDLLDVLSAEVFVGVLVDVWVDWLDPPKWWWREWRQYGVKRERIRELYEEVREYELHGYLTVRPRGDVEWPPAIEDLPDVAYPPGCLPAGHVITEKAMLITFVGRRRQRRGKGEPRRVEPVKRLDPAPRTLWVGCHRDGAYGAAAPRPQC